MRPDLDIDLLRSFAAVADAKQFTLAAERLNRTQSAVSMQIQRLESAVATKLFHRGRRQVRLTSDGEKLRAYAHRMLRLNDEALAAFGQAALQGRIRFAATDTSMCYLPPVLSRFAESYPLIELEIDCKRSWDALEALDAGEHDLALVTQSRGRPDGEVVRREPLVWAAARGSAAGTVDPLPLALFGKGCIYREAATDALDKSGRKWRHAYDSPSRDGLAVAVSAGLAVTIVPQSAMPANWMPLGAEEGFPALPEIEIQLYLRHVWGDDIPAPVAAFAETIRAELSRGQLPAGN
jgi:DNA-binding transcriptional LysR family regulator